MSDIMFVNRVFLLKGLVLLNLKITKINNAKTVLKTVSYNSLKQVLT
jgi:hypothetical protein